MTSAVDYSPVLSLHCNYMPQNIYFTRAYTGESLEKNNWISSNVFFESINSDFFSYIEISFKGLSLKFK